ncbi:MAG: glycosyltransferase [Streptosporangiaceae bacterium]|nr:glycosyltransferase [Streptosporangiaceae bacterium]
MKIAMVAQHATLLRPRNGAGPRPEDTGMRELTRVLAHLGHQVTVYTQKHQPDEPDHAEIDGVRIEQIPAGPVGKPGDADLLAHIPAFSEPLRARWLRSRPDVVHAVNWTSGLAALAAARGLGIPVVQSFSSLGVAERRDHANAKAATPPPARLRLEPAIGRSADAVVAASSAVVSDLTRLGVPRTSVRCVPWGVDTIAFAPDGPAAERNGRPRLLTAADLKEREALETLLRAMAKVPGAELLVVGGPVRDQLARDPAYQGLASMTGALGLSDRVLFTGQVDRQEMPALLRSADLVLSTCSYEPSGVTSLEAMACGKPVVAPPTGGHMDAVVDGTTGILIPPGRPGLLAQRIRHLLAHPMLMEAYGVAGADRAKSRYGWDRIAAETTAVYDQMLKAA